MKHRHRLGNIAYQAQSTYDQIQSFDEPGSPKRILTARVNCKSTQGSSLHEELGIYFELEKVHVVTVKISTKIFCVKCKNSMKM